MFEFSGEFKRWLDRRISEQLLGSPEFREAQRQDDEEFERCILYGDPERAHVPAPVGLMHLFGEPIEPTLFHRRPEPVKMVGSDRVIDRLTWQVNLTPMVRVPAPFSLDPLTPEEKLAIRLRVRLDARAQKRVLRASRRQRRRFIATCCRQLARLFPLPSGLCFHPDAYRPPARVGKSGAWHAE